MPFPFRGNSQTSDEFHTHSRNDHNWCYGKLRRSPETVKRGDVFDADDGQWTPCPPEWIGQDVGDFASTQIVCPSKDDPW